MPDPQEIESDDPFGGRQPTSHERMTGRPWEDSYRGGTAPWDIGRPQGAIARLVSRATITGPMLDAGCGTGEHSLLVASQGVPVVGVDIAETAIAMAQQKARERGLEAKFSVADAFHLDRLGQRFHTVLDCGLFHTLEAGERAPYLASVASVTEPGGTFYVLCFSDQGSDIGPHPVSEQEIRAAFVPSAGWEIVSLEPAEIETVMHDHGLSARLVTAKRV
jgi:SAM-dependent methyltransferase